MSNRAPKEVTKIFSAIEKSKRPKIIFPSSAIVCDNNRLPDYGMVEESCNIWEETILALQNDHFTPTKACACTIAGVIAITFIASSLTGNYSQVDKLWSVIPFVYCWILVADKRTLLMAVVATLWGIRLTWNFNRRGGYKWPVWDGDEDYRWKLLQDGALLDILRNNVAWVVFNLFFISIYQNLLLFLIAAPSLVAHIVTIGCGLHVPLNGYDYLATVLILVFILVESLADNQQYNFQTEKYRLKNAGEPLTGEYADGFKSSGLFAIVRKPNYAGEQAIWISFYIYSIGAVNAQKFVNWSMSGWILLCLLFQGSGWLTEKITLEKYPKYAEYMKEVPLYVPNPMKLLVWTGQRLMHLETSEGTGERRRLFETRDRTSNRYTTQRDDLKT